MPVTMTTHNACDRVGPHIDAHTHHQKQFLVEPRLSFFREKIVHDKTLLNSMQSSQRAKKACHATTGTLKSPLSGLSNQELWQATNFLFSKRNLMNVWTKTHTPKTHMLGKKLADFACLIVFHSQCAANIFVLKKTLDCSCPISRFSAPLQMSNLNWFLNFTEFAKCFRLRNISMKCMITVLFSPKIISTETAKFMGTNFLRWFVKFM